MGTLKTNPCKFVLESGSVCGSKFHTAMYHKRSSLRATKPLNRIGKVARRTQKAVSEWERKQKTNHEGYHECFYCGRWIKYLTAEHTISKARGPEFRTDQSKFVKACDFDNQRKGSMSAEEYIIKFYPQKLYLLDQIPK